MLKAINHTRIFCGGNVMGEAEVQSFAALTFGRLDSVAFDKIN